MKHFKEHGGHGDYAPSSLRSEVFFSLCYLLGKKTLEYELRILVDPMRILLVVKNIQNLLKKWTKLKFWYHCDGVSVADRRIRQSSLPSSSALWHGHGVCA